MARKAKDSSLRSSIDAFSRDLFAYIAEEVRTQVAAAISRIPQAQPSRLDGRRAGRLCPVPGCGKPGAGPRNRWFCKEHAKSLPVGEQKRLLTVAREKGAELRRAESRKRRGGAGRKLDMSCRVAGCKNTSRGPRFGFICDKHRKELSAKEQQAARDKWNEAHKKAA